MFLPTEVMIALQKLFATLKKHEIQRPSSIRFNELPTEFVPKNSEEVAMVYVFGNDKIYFLPEVPKENQ